MSNEFKLLNWVIFYVSADYFGILVETNVLFFNISTPEVKSCKIDLVILSFNQADDVMRTLFPCLTILILIKAMQFALGANLISTKPSWIIICIYIYLNWTSIFESILSNINNLNNIIICIKEQIFYYSQMNIYILFLKKDKRYRKDHLVGNL